MKTATSLLRAALQRPVRPADQLVGRLERPDGAAWLVAALRRTVQLADRDAAVPAVARFGAAHADIEMSLCGGGATIAQLESLKRCGKALVRAATSEDDRLAGLAAYFFAIAAALRSHSTLIGARDEGGARQQLPDVLLDLASATSDPWSTMLAEAALAAHKP